jgi:lysozyme
MTRRINRAGLAHIKSWEGLRLTAYLDVANVLTIGYGSTGSHVKEGMVITEAEAEELLRKDLARFEHGVEALTEGCATSDDQFSALVSLAFNIGLGALATSTVLKRHKLGNRIGAANAFLMWNKAKGAVLKGLMRRREAERALYLGEVA